MSLRDKIGFVAFILFSVFLYGQELPPLNNFAPSDYGAENQNWAISQSENRLIYAANGRGLLEYNGASWRLFPSPNQTIMRSVLVVEDKIYTGCYREFGYWVENDFGIYDYTSLSKKIEDKLLEDEEFWSIVHLEGKVLFQSKKRIYTYDVSNGSIELLPFETSLPRIFNTAKGVFIHTSNEGLFRIVDGKSELVNADDLLRNDEVINVFLNENDLLVATRHRGFYKIANGVLQKWSIPADDMLLENNIYCAIQLKNKRFVLGTVSKGLLILDAEGNELLTIDQSNGLRNNTVLSLKEDSDNNVWMGLDNGIGFIDLNSAFTVFDDTTDDIGSVYAAAQSDKSLYLGTNQGLFVKSGLDEDKFHLIPGTQGQVWSLKKIGDHLFCGHHSGTFLIEGNKAIKIASIPGTWKIELLNEEKDLFIQGNYNGLFVLKKQNADWTVRNKIQGFEYSSRYFEILDTTIFVNHEYKGVFQVRTDSQFLKALEVKIDSLIPGFNSSINTFGNDLYYAHRSGVLIYDKEEDLFKRDTTLSNVYDANTYVSGKMVEDEANENLWFFSSDYISKVYKGKFSEEFFVQNILLDSKDRKSIDGYEFITFLEKNKYLLGTSSGYIIMDLDKMEENPFKVRLNAINTLSRKQSGHVEDFVEKNVTAEFSHDNNNLRFSFYSGTYEMFKTPKYQYRLSNSYPDWSIWSEKNSVTFENLSPGTYSFDVRSKIGNKLSDNIASFSFMVRKPYYLSNTAILLYVLLGLLGSFLIHIAYRNHYRNRQKQIIARTKKEMELEKAKNEKELIKVKNEQLQKEFRSKSNELAASTLSIIRKNELLTKVKDELISSSENSHSIKPLVNIIEKNLKRNDDWELFKEAFNNADRKFLKKLKKAHPRLTPNDIRLCAYLRLNLSSKEIAPMFNISPKSVEIKRYRLRKKMNLSHDENLTDYILKL